MRTYLILGVTCLLLTVGCSIPYPPNWIPPRSMTGERAMQIRYQCKHSAAAYGSSSYAPYSLNQWNNLAMLAQARDEERKDFAECMQMHGFVGAGLP